MSICGKIVHYAPLFAGSKWWKRPLTNLPDENANKNKLLSISSIVRVTARHWIMLFNRLRLGNLPIVDPIPMTPSFFLPIYTDASGVHDNCNALRRGAGVFIANTLVLRNCRVKTNNSYMSTNMSSSALRTNSAC